MDVLLGEAARDPWVAAAVAATSMSTTTQWLLLGLGAMVLVAFFGVQQRQRSRSATPTPRQATEGTQRDIVEVMSQLDQLSRQIHQKIDQRLGKLDALIRLADERIDRLNQLERSQKGAGAIDIELAPETPDAVEKIDEDPNQAIYQLADAGYTPIQIARQLSRHTGEIELILSLRRARRASA